MCGNLVTTNDNLVQNVVQTCQFVLTIEYNQPTQNNDQINQYQIESPLVLYFKLETTPWTGSLE